MLFGETAAQGILGMMSVPGDVIDMAALYLRVYCLGLPVIFLYNFLSAIFRAIGDTRTPLLALTIGGIANVFFNLFFVLVVHLTVDGVAWGTVISNALSTVVLSVRLSRSPELCRFHFRKLRLHRAQPSRMLVIGVPSGIQGMMFSLSNIVVQSAVNSLGSTVMAASSAAFNLEIFAWYVMNSFGQACTTFTAQGSASAVTGHFCCAWDWMHCSRAVSAR